MSRIATRERNNGEREQGSLMHKSGRGKGEGEGKGTNRVWNKGSSFCLMKKQETD